RGDEGHGFPAVDRADARRHPGGDPGGRPAGRQERRPAGGPHPGPVRPGAGRAPVRLVGRPHRLGRRDRGRRSRLMPHRFPLPPGSMIGVLGGGQLGRMLALAAARLGFDVTILEPQPDSPASRVAARTLEAPYDDREALKTLAATCDVVTFEFENVPAAVVEKLETLGALAAPGKRALAIAQDRVDEKTFFQGLGVATADFAAIAGPGDIRAAMARLGGRALLKTRREGYDGKGQTWVEGESDAAAAFARIGRKPAILEARVPFVRELSVIAARSRNGEIACYPVGENRHENGILRTTQAPARLSEGTRAEA